MSRGRNAGMVVVMAVVVMAAAAAMTASGSSARGVREEMEECSAKGFEAKDLRCDVCKRVADVLGPVAERDCHACCSLASPADAAVFVLTQRDVYTYPGVGEFFNNLYRPLSAAAPNVLSTRAGDGPKLVLVKGGKPVAAVSSSASSASASASPSGVAIKTWRSSDIEAFLRANLPPLPYV